MTKVVCDLCGKDVNTSVLLRPIGNYRVALVQYGDTLDLCENCKIALDKWISERKSESGVTNDER